jgi:hypothetical protein
VFEAGLLGFVIGAPLGALTKVENAAMRAAAHKGMVQSNLGRVAEDANNGVVLTEAGAKELKSDRPKVLFVDSQGNVKSRLHDTIYVDSKGRASPDHKTSAEMDDALWLSKYRETLRAETDASIAKMQAERAAGNAAEDARTSFLDRALGADPAVAKDAGDLNEEAHRLWHATFGENRRKPSARELALARHTVSSMVKSEQAAAKAEKSALEAGHDAATAQTAAQKAREEHLAYAQRELQDAGMLPKSTTPPAPEAVAKAEPAAEVRDHGREFGIGDTAWFEKQGKLFSGKVDKVNEHGRVVLKDDVSGKTVSFHPEKDDPTGEYSGISEKATYTAEEAHPFLQGSIGSAQIAHADLPDTKQFAIKIGKWSIPIRWDYFSIFDRSGLRSLRKMAIDLVADPVGYADKSLTRGASASEVAELTRLRYEKRFQASFEDEFGKYYQRTNTSWLKADEARTRFAEAITAITRGDEAAARAFPEAAAVVNEVRSVHKELLGLAQRHGVEGAELIDPDPFYMMRKLNHDRIRMIAQKYDPAAVVSFIKGAITKSRVIDEALAEKVAKGYWKTITELPYEHALSEAVYGPKQFARLRDALIERGVEKDIAEEVIDAVAGRSLKTEGDHARLKHRTVLDELHAADVLTRDGTMERLSMSDFFHNDSRLLMRQYTRQMSGLSALAQVGIRSEADWIRRLDEVKAEAAAAGVDDKVYHRHVQYMNDIRSYMLGRPMSDQPFGKLDRVLKVLRDVNFIRNMGQAGFAQVPEIGSLMGHAGMRAFAMHVPAMGDILTHLKAGTLDDALSRDLINMGLGGESLSIKPQLRDVDEWQFDRQLSKFEQVVEKGKYITANVSGLAAMNDALSTMASKMFVQKFSDYANGFSKLGKKDLEKLNWAGIGEDNLDGIFARIKEHVKLGEKGKVEEIDWEGWSKADHQSFDAFNLAVFREARKAIQQPTIGETSPWMHSQIGKVLTQFRSFTLVSWAKQTLHGIHYADASTAAAWGLSTIFAGLGYAAQTSLNFAHNPGERDKRLQPEEIAKAAFQRAGFSSLIPAGIDTVAEYSRGQPYFAYGRTTGLGTGFIVGNPTFDLVATKGLGTLQNVTRSVLDDDHAWTRKDVKNGLGLFMPNYLGVRNFVDAASQEFPARNPLQQHKQ